MEPKALPCSPVSSSMVILSLLMRRARSSASFSSACFALGTLRLEGAQPLHGRGRDFERFAAGNEKVAGVPGFDLHDIAFGGECFDLFSEDDFGRWHTAGLLESLPRRDQRDGEESAPLGALSTWERANFTR